MADSRNNYHTPPDYTVRQMTSPVAETSIPRNPPPSYDSLARNSTPIQPTQTAPSHNAPLQPNVHPPPPHAPPPHNATPHGVPRRFTSTAAAPTNNARPTDPLSGRPGNNQRYYGSFPEWTEVHNRTSAPFHRVNAVSGDLVLLGVPRREYEAALERQQWRANCLKIRMVFLCVFIFVVIPIIVVCAVVSSNSGDDSGDDDDCGPGCSLIGDTCYC